MRIPSAILRWRGRRLVRRQNEILDNYSCGILAEATSGHTEHAAEGMRLALHLLLEAWEEAPADHPIKIAEEISPRLRPLRLRIESIVAELKRREEEHSVSA